VTIEGQARVEYGPAGELRGIQYASFVPDK